MVHVFLRLKYAQRISLQIDVTIAISVCVKDVEWVRLAVEIKGCLPMCQGGLLFRASFLGKLMRVFKRQPCLTPLGSHSRFGDTLTLI